jgi:hypothetical protein
LSCGSTAVHSLVPYEGTAARNISDALQIGGFESRSPLIANVSDGSSGFTGGTISAAAPSAGATPELPATTKIMTGVAMAPVPDPALPLVGQRLPPAGRIRGNLNPIPSLGPISLGPGSLGYSQFGSKVFAKRVRAYVEAVNSNRPRSWDEIGLGFLDDAEREVVKMRALDAGFVPRIPINPRT